MFKIKTYDERETLPCPATLIEEERFYEGKTTVHFSYSLVLKLFLCLTDKNSNIICNNRHISPLIDSNFFFYFPYHMHSNGHLLLTTESEVFSNLIFISQCQVN